MGASKDNETKVLSHEDKIATSEKVSVNMTAGTLAQIDMLVEKGYYANRSDFINVAVRSDLDSKSDLIGNITETKEKNYTCFFVGVTKLDKKDFEKWKLQNTKASINGYGILILPEGCDDLITETVESIHVTGKIYCSERIKKVYLPHL